VKLTLVDGDVCIAEYDQPNSLQQQHAIMVAWLGFNGTFGTEKAISCL